MKVREIGVLKNSLEGNETKQHIREPEQSSMHELIIAMINLFRESQNKLNKIISHLLCESNRMSYSFHQAL